MPGSSFCAVRHDVVSAGLNNGIDSIRKRKPDASRAKCVFRRQAAGCHAFGGSVAFAHAHRGAVLLQKGGSDELSGLLPLLGLQAVWAISLFAIGTAFWNYSVRKITVNGG